MLVQRTIEKPRPWLGSGEHRQTGTHHISTTGIKPKEKLGGDKKPSDSEDIGMRIITLAGENKGALLELIKSPNKTGERSQYLHKNGTGRVVGSDGKNAARSSSSSSSDSDDGKAKKDMSQKGKANNGLPMTAFMNSNVQGINNSIMYNSSCTHHDPGVHLALTRKPNGSGFQVKDRVTGHDHK